MSATLDTSKLQNYLNNAPHISIPRRVHPIANYYLKEPCEDYLAMAVSTAIRLHQQMQTGSEKEKEGDKVAQSNLPNPIPGVSPEKEEEGDEAAQSNIGSCGQGDNHPACGCG